MLFTNIGCNAHGFGVSFDHMLPTRASYSVAYVSMVLAGIWAT
jgi:hypothetical protein